MQGTTPDDYVGRKLDELDRLLNDPDVPMQPALIWRLVDEVAEWDRRDGQRLPAGYGPSASPRLHVVGDAWKQSAQLDGGRKLASLIEGGADRDGI